MGAYMRRGRPDVKTVLEYFPWLEARRGQQAGTLSGGEQQMLALARAFLQRPRLLMLDEPSLGLAPLITREVFRVVGDLNQKEGLAVLVVEQNAAIALGVAARAYVLETGSVTLTGAADELRANDAVRSAYLGY
jgi:branched-chain amino acid transport system ATP-binding protein